MWVGLNPGLRRSPGEGHSNPLHFSCLENPMNRGVWWATVPSVPESEMSEATACTHNFFSRKEKGKKILSYECIIPSVSSVTHLCPTLLRFHGCSPARSSVHGILQARILEWVAIPFSRGSFQPRTEPRYPALKADSLPFELPGNLNTFQATGFPF